MFNLNINITNIFANKTIEKSANTEKKQDLIEQNLQILNNVLNKIQNNVIDFTQYHLEHGTKYYKVTGALIISKPDRFRLSYYAPFPLLIIGNKNYVSLYDYDYHSVTRISKDNNPLLILTTEASKSNINDNFDVIDAIMHNNDTQDDDNQNSWNDSSLEIKLFHRKSAKNLVIILDKKSKSGKDNSDYQLNQIIIEQDNIYFNVDNIYKITDIKKSLFIIKDPEIFGKQERLNKGHLYNMFTKL